MGPLYLFLQDPRNMTEEGQKKCKRAEGWRRVMCNGIF